MTEARKHIERIPIAQRSDKAWESAYNLARGANFKRSEDFIRQDERKKAMSEFALQGGAGMAGGSGSGNKKIETDMSKVSLTETELRTAKAMLRGGMIPDIDTYKRQKVAIAQSESEE